MLDEKQYCVECHCEVPVGLEAYMRITGELVCPLCFLRQELAEVQARGAYSDGR
jgi:hypothetical protein